MKILCVFGKYNYGDSSRGVGYEYANFIPAFRNLGHEVIFFESLDKSAYKNYIELNRGLLETVNKVNPDIIFFVLMNYEVWLETLEMIREYSKAVLIHWATDDSWKYEQFSRYMAPFFDLYVTTYISALYKAEKDGHLNFTLSQWAANSSTFKIPRSSQECLYDVTLIGTKYGNRNKWVENLNEKGINVTCFGYGWPKGAVKAEEIPQIINKSRICINLADSGLMLKGRKISCSRQIKARVFEVPGAGGMLITEPAENLEEFYKLNDEIMVFEGLDDLTKKIDYLLKNPEKRDDIAEAGYRKTVKEHSYEIRFEELIKKAIDKKRYKSPLESKINMEKFEEISSAHKVNIFQVFIKIILLVPCVLIWGKKRGPRAARRLIFEISWRVLGKKTYSVIGLPGRLFYKVS